MQTSLTPSKNADEYTAPIFRHETRGRTENDRADDERQQLHPCGGAKGIPRDHLHESLNEARSRLDGSLGSGGGFLELGRQSFSHTGIDVGARFDRQCEHQTDEARDERCHEKVDECLATDSGQASRITEG